jgi:hypothetical protein
MLPHANVTVGSYVDPCGGQRRGRNQRFNGCVAGGQSLHRSYVKARFMDVGM